MPDPAMPDPTPPRPVVTLEDRIRALADEAAVESGLYIVGVSVKGHPGSRVVEVFADGDGAAAGIDELAGLTRRLNVLLDLEDPVSGRYRLDVSTPGADRPLVDLRQYPQHVGRTLAVSYGDAEAQVTGTQVTGTQVTGTLVEATPEGITVQPDPPGKKGAAPDPVTIAAADLREARVVLPW